MSIANSNGYGMLSRIIFPLEQPSDLEVVLMSTVRLYHIVTKVSSTDGKGGLKSIPRVDIVFRGKRFPNCPREPFLVVVQNLNLRTSETFPEE